MMSTEKKVCQIMQLQVIDTTIGVVTVCSTTSSRTRLLSASTSCSEIQRTCSGSFSAVTDSPTFSDDNLIHMHIFILMDTTMLDTMPDTRTAIKMVAIRLVVAR